MRFVVEYIQDFGDWNEVRIAQYLRNNGADRASIKIRHIGTEEWMKPFKEDK